MSADVDERILAVEHRGLVWDVACRYRVGKGETLLYFHGLGGERGDFRGAWEVPEWSGYTLVAFDAPGCGATAGYRPGVPLGVDDIVVAAETLATHLGLQGVTVVGHSMGGLAGLLFARRNPAIVRRIVSVEGNLGPEDCSLYSRRVFRERFLGREGHFMDALEREMRDSGVPGLPEAAAVLGENVQAPAFFDYCRSLVGYCDHSPLLEAFCAVDVPRLYVYGAHNAHISHVPVLETRGVRIERVPDSGHFPMLSNPAAYFQLLADFVGGADR